MEVLINSVLLAIILIGIMLIGTSLISMSSYICNMVGIFVVVFGIYFVFKGFKKFVLK